MAENTIDISAVILYAEDHERTVNVYKNVFEDMHIELFGEPQVIDLSDMADYDEIHLKINVNDMDDAYQRAIPRANDQLRALSTYDSLPKTSVSLDPSKPTVVVNMFGGPGSGKTTAALEVVEKLKKAGYVVEYAPEYAKELVWDMNDPKATQEQRMQARELLSGSYESQCTVYAEQLKRIRRCVGQCDFVVTDSPPILGVAYLKEDYPQQREDFERVALHDFNGMANHMANFNMVVERGSTYEQAGRYQTPEEAEAIDANVTDFLDRFDIYHGTYNHRQIDKAIENMQKTFSRISAHAAAVEKLKAGRTERDESMTLKEGQVFHYTDTDHKGPSYSPWDDLSGTYRITDASSYPNVVRVELVGSDTGQSFGEYSIFRFDDQVRSGEIEFMADADNAVPSPEPLPFPAPSMLEMSPRQNGLDGEILEYRFSGEEHAYELTFEHMPETEDWMARVYIDDGKLGKPTETACYTSLHPTFKEAYNRAYERVCDEIGFVKITDSRPGGKALRIDKVFSDKEISRIQQLKEKAPGQQSNQEPQTPVRTIPKAR